MSRRSLADRDIRKIFKSSSSYCMTIPLEIIHALKWKEKQKIKVKKVKGGFVVRDCPPGRAITRKVGKK